MVTTLDEPLRIPLEKIKKGIYVIKVQFENQEPSSKTIVVE